MSDDRNMERRPSGSAADERGEVATIPLVEERLTVAKRQVESGRLRVHVGIDEHEEIVRQELLGDQVEVERIPRNVPLAEIPHVRLEGSTTVIPVVEEVLVVEKRLMLVEEIHVHRRPTTEQREVAVTLRSERATVGREAVAPGDGAPLTDDREPRP